MAEFPDLGQNCAVSLCRVLDFAPFNCNLCGKTYCSQHRFSHGCNLGNQNTIEERISAAPLNVFLCSSKNCSTAEAVKIVCEHCKNNFCLKHRDILDHKCEHAPVQSTSRTEEIEQIREKLDFSQSASLSHPHATSTTKKILSEAEQKRADRIALMKLKSGFAKGNNFGSDGLIVFVEWADRREPVQVNKRWTIGKSVSEMVSAVKSPQNVKVRKRSNDSILDFSQQTGEVLLEGDTLLLFE